MNPEVAYYVWLGVLAVIVLYLLFMDAITYRLRELRKQRDRRRRPGILRRLVRFLWATFHALAGLFMYGILLGIPLLLFIFFVPVLHAANRLGLTAQDIQIFARKDKAQEQFKELTPTWEELRSGDGLDREKMAARKAAISQRLGRPIRFGRDVWQAFVEWGAEIKEREYGGKLPPSLHPNVQSLAARDREFRDHCHAELALRRLQGQDALADRGQELINHIDDQGILFSSKGDFVRLNKGADILRNYGSLALFLHVFYPNDDIAYLLATASATRDESELKTYFWHLVLGFTILALLIQRGLRIFTVSWLGRLLWLQRHPVFQEYERDVFNSYRNVLCTLLVLGASWYLAQEFMEPFYVFSIANETLFSAAVLWNGLIGGALVESLGSVVTLLFIRIGVNPFRVLWDNVLALAGSVAILWYFQNSWFSIATGLGIGLLGNLVNKVLTYFQKGDAWDAF